MAPRRSESVAAGTKTSRTRLGPSQDRRRNIEDASHHPAKKKPVSHKTRKKEKLPPRHTPHSRPHGDELGPHLNKPSPIKPRKTMTRTGAKEP